jgi:hypothetical protein
MKVADSVQISCINKHQHHNPHERIQSVGGMHGGKPWKLTEEEAIAGIKQGKWNFYTSVSGRSVWVVIIRSRRQGGRTVSIAINTSSSTLPALFAPDASAGRRFVEFFTANIRNPHTRRAYHRIQAVS